MADHMVRMAELAVSATAGDVLVALGLGSCIGVALVDDAAGVAGLAHVVLPDSREAASVGAPAKFADTAVPELLARVTRAGATPRRLWATLVGGAQMFASAGAGNLDIGVRNERAVRAALVEARIPVRAARTGGSVGRTVRVYVDGMTVTCKDVGSGEAHLAGTARRAA